MASARAAASTARIRGLFRSRPPGPGGADLGGQRQFVEQAARDEPGMNAVQHGAEPPGHVGQPGDDVRELLQGPAGLEGLGVVHDRLEPQHALAFGIALQRQQPEVDLEQRQVIRRSLDHHCQLQRRLGACQPGAASSRTGSAARARPAGTGSGRRWCRRPGPSARRRRRSGSGCTRPGRPSRSSGTRWPAGRPGPGRSAAARCRSTGAQAWPSRPIAAGCDKVSAIWARPRGSVIQVKQFPSLVNPIPAA